MGVQVVNTEPTGALSALLTTSDGISLVFDPLIRKPTQVAADIVDNIAQGRRRRPAMSSPLACIGAHPVLMLGPTSRGFGSV